MRSKKSGGAKNGWQCDDDSGYGWPVSLDVEQGVSGFHQTHGYASARRLRNRGIHIRPSANGFSGDYRTALGGSASAVRLLCEENAVGSSGGPAPCGQTGDRLFRTAV